MLANAIFKVVIPANAYMDVGGRAKHDCMDAGGRSAPGKALEELEPSGQSK
jgi:hypothetical protein